MGSKEVSEIGAQYEGNVTYYFIVDALGMETGSILQNEEYVGVDAPRGDTRHKQ